MGLTGLTITDVYHFPECFLVTYKLAKHKVTRGLSFLLVVFFSRGGSGLGEPPEFLGNGLKSKI